MTASARRVNEGEPWAPVVRELLDSLALARVDDDLTRLVETEPDPADAKVDAYLAPVVARTVFFVRAVLDPS